ncbi:hemolysin-type calcium-binding repeat family protein [Synechococcus sp. PROS-7-1]|uniref:tyrosinase family protein n=1 Tax=Synechococcus sp. PROS-7-1 TaxID=1442556 RepID=UPI001645F7E9|nr:tyrosinase family protein [Synechococcus sp. PROS-7-1]QNI84798.1 hemolysin-type calcium-binding repeat family protein [Synechococcus sp. PROS-7-1]
MNFAQLLSRFAEPESRSLETSNSERVRHNVETPDGAKALALFEKAVGLMKEKSALNPGDPLGWTYQAGIHGLWNLDVEQPEAFNVQQSERFVDFAVENGFDTRENMLNGDTVLNNCTHFAGFWNGSRNSIVQRTTVSDGAPANFMAWHRLYLQYFEEIARENLRLSGDPDAETWALPYWAYLNEEQTVMPKLLRDPESSLYTPYRNPGFNAGTSINDLGVGDIQPASWSSTALKGLGATGYLSMGTRIEYTPHNQFHRLSGLDGGLFPDGDGLMLPPGSAAFDPVFWIHHSFIDKIWSAYNKKDNAFYAFEYEFDQTPWNYAFLTPSRDGSLQKDVVSSWGDDSPNVISKIYNPDYSYDYFGALSNPVDEAGPNKVLSILQSPAFRPIVSDIDWGIDAEARSAVVQDGRELSYFQSVIPLTIDGRQLTYEAYRGFAGEDAPFNLVANINFKLPSPPAFARFVLTTKDIVEDVSFEEITFFDIIRRNRGLFVQDMPMGSMSMPMAKTATMDFGYSDYSFFGNPNIDTDDLVAPGDEMVLLMLSDSADTSVQSLSLGLTENLNKASTRDSDFDSAAYFSQFPELLLNREATEDPEGYYNANDKPRGVVAPEVNFRAAALGMAYLAENPDLIEQLESSSPYVAVADYLDQGLKQGRSLGDGALRSSRNYFRRDRESDAVILDLTLLPLDGEAVVDVVTGREADFDSTLGFYRVVDDLGTVVVDGVRYQPGHADYARMATSNGNRFDPLTGFSASQERAERSTGIGLTADTGRLAPFAVVNDQTLFTFAEANADGLNHFRVLAPNTLGFEDFFAGGDTDFDDALASFRFTLPGADELLLA